MSSASAVVHSPLPSAGVSQFLLRRLHSLTGIVFGGYLVVHLLVNATLIEGSRHDGGPTVFQMQVDKIHSLPFLAVIETVVIYLPILYHTVYGIWITLTGQPNVTNYPYAKNWFYLLQRISAIYIVFFMVFHVFALKFGLFGTTLSFDPENAAATVHRHMTASSLLVWIVYPLGILASCYHLANGFWTAAITWGLTVSAGAQRRWGLACAGLFAVTFVAAMIALIAAARLDPNNVPLGPSAH